MAPTQRLRAFGVFLGSQELEGAWEELKAANFPMEQVSILAREARRTEVDVPYPAQNVTDTGAVAGGAVGSAAGLIAGLGTAATIPGFGPVIALGAAATALISTLTGGVIGVVTGALVGMLTGYGIPEEQAVVYSDRIDQGSYFVMIEGSEAEVRQAEAILGRWNVQELRTYAA